MKNEKNQKNMKKKYLPLLLLLLVLTVSVAGTVAYLVTAAQTVKNTFTIGKIEIELTETDASSNEKEYTNFLPGDTLSKDAKVTVKNGSEKCYVFVRIDEANNTITDLSGKVIAWQIAGDWTQINSSNIYYRVVEKPTTEGGTALTVFKDNQVTVNRDITINHLETLNSNKPTITVSAAAVQVNNLNAESAFEQLPSEFRGSVTWHQE